MALIRLVLSINNLNVIVQLKWGWQYVIREDKALSLKIEQNINLLVARYDSLNPGSFRTDSVTVELGNNKGEWKPQELDYQSEMDFFNNLMQKDTSITDKAMTLMYHNVRKYWLNISTLFYLNTFSYLIFVY